MSWYQQQQWDDRRGSGQYGGGWGRGGGSDRAHSSFGSDKPFQYGLLEGLTGADLESLRSSKKSEEMKQATRDVMKEGNAGPDLDALRGLATSQREAPRASGSGGPNADDVAAALMRNEAFVNALTGKRTAEAEAKREGPAKKAKEDIYDIKVESGQKLPMSFTTLIATSLGITCLPSDPTVDMIIASAIAQKGAMRKVNAYAKDHKQKIDVQERAPAPDKARAVIHHMAEQFLAQLRSEVKQTPPAVL